MESRHGLRTLRNALQNPKHSRDEHIPRHVRLHRLSCVRKTRRGRGGRNIWSTYARRTIGLLGCTASTVPGHGFLYSGTKPEGKHSKNKAYVLRGPTAARFTFPSQRLSCFMFAVNKRRYSFQLSTSVAICCPHSDRRKSRAANTLTTTTLSRGM